MNTSYLDPKFIMAYTKKQPKWGFNGLGYLVYKRTYARLKENELTEEWWETIQRCVNGAEDIGRKVTNNPYYTKDELERLYDYIFNLKGSFAGRMLWQLGTSAIEKIGQDSNNNCWSTRISCIEDFIFVLTELMLGGGVGFSVRAQDIYKLPQVKENIKITHLSKNDTDFIVPDSREGWAELLRKVLSAFLETGKNFSYSTILLRDRGAPIETFGGTASGPQILIDGIDDICKVLRNREGKFLRSVDVLDIVTRIGSIVKAGSVRRSALLALGDPDDVLFLQDKRWDLGNIPSWRAVSNNTIAADSVEQISDLFWDGYYGNGEPYGLFNLKNARKYGRLGEVKLNNGIILPNPCSEILLENRECCCLSEIFLPNIVSYKEFIDLAILLYKNQKAILADTFMHNETNKVVHKNMKIGLSVTGYLQSTPEQKGWLDPAYKEIEKFDKSWSKQHNWPKSIRLTCVKPSGCRPWDSLTTTDNGILTLEELFEDHNENKDWDSFKKNINVLQNEQKNKITKTYNNGLSEIFEIKTSYNITVKSTGNHKWWVKSNYKHERFPKEVEINEWKETKDLIPGDCLDIIPGIYTKFSHSKLKLINALSLKMRGGYTDILQPLELDPDLAWFLGYLWGDGSMSPSKFRLRWIDARKDNLEKIQRILFEKFELVSTIHKASQHRKAFTLEIGNKLLWHWLIKNNIFKYYNNQLDLIPQIVRESSHEDIIAFLAGLIDADGCIQANNNFNNITLATAYDLFAKHVQDVALSVGISFGRSLNTKGKNKQSQKHIWLLSTNAESVDSRFKILLKHSNKTKLENVPKPNLPWNHELKEKRKKRGRILGKIEEIKILPEKENTYDIEVENNHWYYAGAIKSHNTLSLLAGCTPGVHPGFSKYHIRRVEIDSQNKLVQYCRSLGYKTEYALKGEEIDYNTVKILFPCKYPEGTVLAKDVSAIDQLETVVKLQKEWADNSISVTVYYRPEELEDIKLWLKDNYDKLKTVSFLRHSDHGFAQPVLEEITEEQYNEMVTNIKQIETINFNTFSEDFDSDCEGGACPVR